MLHVDPIRDINQVARIKAPPRHIGTRVGKQRDDAIGRSVGHALASARSEHERVPRCESEDVGERQGSEIAYLENERRAMTAGEPACGGISEGVWRGINDDIRRAAYRHFSQPDVAQQPNSKGQNGS